METVQTWIHYQATINDLKAQNAKLVAALKAALQAIDAFWPADKPENESEASEDAAIARVRKQARAVLKEVGE